MPNARTLQAFIDCVVGGDHAGAIERYYTADASMRENRKAPRRGRDALVANERAVLARARRVVTHCVPPVLQSGDHVVIRWIFEFDWLDGRQTRIEELAWQRWEGELIAEEEFFYDPGQVRPPAPPPPASNP